MSLTLPQKTSTRFFISGPSSSSSCLNFLLSPSVHVAHDVVIKSRSCASNTSRFFRAKALASSKSPMLMAGMPQHVWPCGIITSAPAFSSTLRDARPMSGITKLMRQPAKKPTFVAFSAENAVSNPPLPPFTKGGYLISPFEKGGLRGILSMKNLFARGGTSLSSVIYGSGNLLCRPPASDASLKITR